MLTQEKLKELLDYDFETGIFIWKPDPKNSWSISRKYAGSVTNKGYLTIRVQGKAYLAHRLAWMFIHGYLPTKRIDHRDHDKLNNRIKNLREATIGENVCNRPTFKNNKSGVKGVYWNKVNNNWLAYVDLNKKRYYLGSFTDINEAAEVVRLKREELHGAFTNH